MISRSDQSRSAPTRLPPPLFIRDKTVHAISCLIAESLISQAFNAYRDTKLHEWVSDPILWQKTVL